MYQDLPTRRALQNALDLHGLQLRGGFVPQPTDDLPSLPKGREVAVVWMVGVVGSAFWTAFRESSQYRDGQPDPLDRWSAAIGHTLAERWEGHALYPFDGPPWLPFQQWADRCEPTQRSAMGLRIHPEYGLWHAYRFALALPWLQASDLPAAEEGQRPPAAPDLCLRCEKQPCLHTCPVDAYTASGFALQSCADHLHSLPGQSCMSLGCQARLACPVGTAFRYEPDHAAFHMQAFLNSHAR